MSSLKPVWRLNAGLSIPNDNLEHALLRCGKVTNTPQNLMLSGFDFAIEDRFDDVIAYETTRTKAAKYRGVK